MTGSTMRDLRTSLIGSRMPRAKLDGNSSHTIALQVRQEIIDASSGIRHLDLLVRTLGTGLGDEVFATPFSFIASSNCILYDRAKPVFVDIEPDTANIDPNLT